MNCKNCGGRDLLVVRFNAAVGATFIYCRYCERRWWGTDDTELGVTDILEAAATIEPGAPHR